MKSFIYDLLKKFNKTYRRFPVCVLFIGLLTMNMLTMILADQSPHELTYFLSVSVLLALLLHLVTEASGRHTLPTTGRDVKGMLLWCAPFLLLGADCTYLYFEKEWTMSELTAQIVMVGALLAGTLLLPFRQEKDDLKAWHFARKLTIGAIITEVAVDVTCAGLFFLYYGSCQLFGLNVDEKVTGVLVTLCMVTLRLLLYLVIVPAAPSRQTTELPRSSYLLGTFRYLFLPLTILYMAVLYVYGIRIALTWTLPHGTLSTLVSALMCAIVTLFLVFYPYINNSEKKGYEVKATRMMLPMMLPLLVLMSIGVGRRLYDYGITAHRLYLLTFNIWFYFVAIGLWIQRGHRVHWVIGSLTLVMVLTSCHPWNYYSIYRNVLINRYNAIAEEYPQPSEVQDISALNDYLRTIPEEKANEFYQILVDLRRYDYKLFREVVGVSGYLPPTLDMEEECVLDIYDYQAKGDSITIPEGYRYFEEVSIDLTYHIDPNAEKKNEHCITDHEFTDSTFQCIIQPYGTFTIRYRGLKDHEDYFFSSTNGHSALLLRKIDFRDYNQSVWVSGYVFFNKQ